MKRASAAADALRAVGGNRDLRRMQLAWAGSVVGEWAYIAALVTYSYERGGATAVGLLGLFRALAGALAAPVAGTFGDRLVRSRVMAGSEAVRAATLAAAALALTQLSSLVLVTVVVAVEGACSTVFRPAQAAEIPVRARTPEEVTAANAVSSTIESVGFLAGPALGGLLYAAFGISVVLAVVAALLLASAATVARLSRSRPEPAAAPASSILGDAAEGLRAIADDPSLRLLLGLSAVQVLVAGGLVVLISAMALDVLELGRASVGLLQSVLGVGAVLGGVLALALERATVVGFVAGLVAWGAPIALAGAASTVVVVAGCLFLVGLANAIVDVAGVTLVQALTPPALAGRVFGTFEGIFIACAGLGGVLASALIVAVGIRSTFVAMGLVLPLLVLACGPALVRLRHRALLTA